jgi:hypothetical protein
MNDMIPDEELNKWKELIVAYFKILANILLGILMY